MNKSGWNPFIPGPPGYKYEGIWIRKISEDCKASCDICEVCCTANCAVCPILNENSLICYKFRLCIPFLIKLSEQTNMKLPQAFLHFVLKVITQENGLFCGKADNFFPCEGLSLLVFSAEDNTNTWVTKHIPSFKYFQVIICLCMLLCLNQALWVLQTGRNRGAEGNGHPEPEQK